MNQYKQMTSEERAVDAARLARLGAFRCLGCQEPHAMDFGVVLGYRGNVVGGLCMPCMTRNDILITRTDEGIHIGFSKREGLVIYEREPAFNLDVLKPKSRKIEDLSEIGGEEKA